MSRAVHTFAVAVFLFTALPLGSIACGQETAREERSYEVEGTIRRIDREAKSITIAHENVPGYMPAMTMPFSVEDAHLFAGLAEGDRVRFRFSPKSGGKHVVTSIEKL
ncbi:MAG: copper-binding protein [Polyangiaceae bacterium]|nr:copper-binding protein [Polyangiaceae bacterium]